MAFFIVARSSLSSFPELAHPADHRQHHRRRGPGLRQGGLAALAARVAETQARATAAEEALAHLGIREAQLAQEAPC